MNTTKCDSIEEFVFHTKELFEQSPGKTRFVFKYRQSKGDFSLKTTNNERVIKYRTADEADLRKMDKVNGVVMAATVGQH